MPVLPDIRNTNLADFKLSSATGLLVTFYCDSDVEYTHCLMSQTMPDTIVVQYTASEG
jgi:hypothetical protein